MQEFLAAFFNLCSPAIMGWMIVGTAVGILFGAVPGMSAGLAVTVFLPITYGLDIITAAALMISLYIGGISGGLISAILINIPGTPSSVATTFDGSPMAKKGEGGKALGAAVFFSFIATLFSVASLICIAPTLAKLAIKFGPYEYFAITACSMLLVAGLFGKNMIKGLISVLIGISAGMVGMAPVDAAIRFTFGIDAFRTGFHAIPVLVGLFALPEVLAYARKRIVFEQMQAPKVKGLGFSFTEFKEQIVNFFRSSLIGLGIGILPGIGAGTSNLVAYAVAKNSSKTPEKFGQGELSGVVASESANNAGIGGAMIPLLSLGIPGDTVTVMLLAGLLLQGIQVGPRFFTSYPDLAYSIFGALIICSFLMFIIENLGMRLFVKLLGVPLHFLLPVVMFVCFLGSYSATNNMLNMWVLLIFGIVGYILTRVEVPLGPAIIGFVLGPSSELYLRRGLQMSGDSFWPFIQSPLAATIMAVGVLFIIWKAVNGIRMLNLAKKESHTT